jgi:hypothetical protein
MRGRTTQTKRLHKKKLVKVHFSFILFLALGAIIDPYVELRCADVKVESHKEALMEVMVLNKL